jgi:hypothetical protein
MVSIALRCPHQMGKHLLNLTTGEPLALVQEFPYFDNSIKLDPLLASALNLSVPDLIHGCMFHEVRVDIYQCQLLYNISDVSNNGGKYGRRRSTLNTGCRTRKGGILSSKALSPTTLVWCKVHSEVDEASNGVL